MLKKIKKIYNPEVFQGKRDMENYFEGWYFKHVSPDLKHVISFIPGISLGKDRHSFIQVMSGTSGYSEYFRYPADAFDFQTDEFRVSVGESEFSSEGIKIDIKRDDTEIKGDISYSGITPWPGSLINPGIMGWYSFVPFMECYHGVVSMNHFLKGSITQNGESIDLSGGKGYIEKDWGKSFPSSWVWLQSNNFNDPEASFMLSIARIPWLKGHFTGHLCFLKTSTGLYRMMTYTGAKVKKLDIAVNSCKCIIEDKNHIMEINARQLGTAGLIAPDLGNMDRPIKESHDSEVEVRLMKKGGGHIFHDKTVRAGMEIHGDTTELTDDLKL